MSNCKLKEGQPPSYQATTETPQPQEAPPMYEPTPYPPQGTYQAQHTDIHVNTNQPIIVVQPEFGPCSKFITCPNCQASISTSLEYYPGCLTYLLSGGICVFGCWLGCCLIPFCVNDVQDVKHTCPSCTHFVGIYKRIR